MAAKKLYAIVHHFPGGTKKQYQASLAAVHPAKNQLPKGQVLHLAGKVKGGWMIVAVHSSKKSWVQFRDKKLMPTMKNGIKGGFKGPPQASEIEVANLQW